LIEEDHPARAIWEFLGDVDLSAFEQGIKAVEGRPGQTTLQPRLLIALWLFACAEGVNSARELSRLCRDAPAYRWLCGDEPVNYHTLSDFRVAQGEPLQRLFIEVLAVLSCAGLIGLKRVTHDGTRIRSVAGNDSFRGEKNLQKHLQEAALQVEAMSQANEEEASAREKAARKRAARERKERLEQAQAQLQQIQAKKSAEEKEKARASLTEPEARIMRQAREGGYVAGYNAQISMDTKAGVIINLDVTQEASDAKQLIPALEQIKETFGSLPAQTLVDSGYTNRSNIMELDGRTDVIGPLDQQEQTAKAQQVRNGVSEQFRTEKFPHDAATNTLKCPAGETLRFVQDRDKPGKVDHIFRAAPEACAGCASKSQCCPNSASRTVMRIEECEAVTRFRAKMDTPEAKSIYKERSQGEFPNCWIKEKLGLRRFHVRGLAKVNLEALWHVITYNVQLWIRKCWLSQGEAEAVA
jgi:transposase